MRNPYEVLGVKQHASPSEIKAAYRTLVKKYHPDKYQNNPLADLAEEKLQEVNEAYDILTKNPAQEAGYYGQPQGGFQQQYQQQYQQQSGGSQASDSNIRKKYNDIRTALDAGQLVAAEQLLIKMELRDAEWFFLSGMLSYKKGWYDDALSNITEAMNMDPNNLEYRRIYQSVINSNGNFRERSQGQGYNSNMDDCTKLMQCYCCYDCCCTPCVPGC